MHSISGVAASPAAESSVDNKRRHYRHPIPSLVYVTLDEGNGGIIRNLSQHGAAIQAVGALRPGQSVRMRFDLLNPRARFDVRAQVTWATTHGQAGVRFVEIPRHSSRQMSDWIFLHLLRAAEQITPVFFPGEAEELILSATARPAIRMPMLGANNLAVPAPDIALSLPWWPRPISPAGLTKLMDGLVLCSAMLMFFCIFLAIAQTIPAWPIAIFVAVGVSGFFVALYGFLCSWVGCGTAGAQLARMAMRDLPSHRGAREEEPRFR
jgi:hypothetical protein